MSSAARPPYRTRPGSRFPLGASVRADGVNFCVYSRHATGVALLLYAGGASAEPYQTIELASERNRTYFLWHVLVEGLPPGAHYAWRMDGPKDTRETGRYFDPHKELVDPCARAIADELWDRRRAADPSDRAHAGIRGIVTGHLPVRVVEPAGLEGAVVYELHVGGFTRHPSSGVRHPGTFAGVIEKIPYLRDLGVTHVELMPVMAFDEQDVPPQVAARGLRNFWGYSTYGFFSPHPRYCVNPANANREFRALADALHAAGLRVIVDVAFNHTAEGGERGPIIGFKGMANESVYHLDRADRRRYLDYTGCGNTMNCNHPIVTAYVLHCLEYWVEELGVDGFRFDLASVFARGADGEVLANPPLPWAIESSRILSRVPLIAEAWDAAGLYQVGAFPGMAWAEWNGRYRDAVRRFVRGDSGMAAEMATRIAASADLYGGGRLPANSVNFVTSHDGFTLADLVSYDTKRNEANGEGGRDGVDDNASWNCGVEGDTADPDVIALRRRQARNHLAILMLSRGVPMLLAGDEVLRTQRGNNNAWCQDNEISWIDWRRTREQEDMLRFTRELIALRRRHACLERNRFFDGRPLPDRGLPDIAWHGARLGEPPWRGGDGRVLAFTVAGIAGGEEDLHVVLNMSHRVIDAGLPAIPGRRWHVALDTAGQPPDDVFPRARQRAHAAAARLVAPRSVVVLEAR